MGSLGDKEIVFLIGAGCSCDANIPMSKTMIEKIEQKLDKDNSWKKYAELYHYIKSSMAYGDMLTKRSGEFNIEKLLVVLNILSEYKGILVYPFFNGFSQDLLEYAGKSFENIRDFKSLIMKELPTWVTLSSYASAEYYKGFEEFQSQYTFALRIFSLNYDLCVERALGEKVETGFRPDSPWDGNNFYSDDNSAEKPIYLYKLHGSINWVRETTKGNQLFVSEQQGITPDIIFGTDVKLQAIDPYLFYLYEFRRYTLEAKIIVVIGYSFNDDHINNLLKQAIESNSSKLLLSVSHLQGSDAITKERARIIQQLNFKENEQYNKRIIIESARAKDFLTNKLKLEYIKGHLSDSEDTPF